MSANGSVGSLRVLVVILLMGNVILATLLVGGGTDTVTPDSATDADPSLNVRQPAADQSDSEAPAAVVRLADQIRDESGGSASTLKDLNAWIACSIGTEESRQIPNVEDVIAFMAGSCGWRDELFSGVADHLGLNHRRVGFLNVPTIVSHAATEIRVDGQWLFFDSSIGRFFSSPARPGWPLSINEIRSRWPDVLIMSVADDLNQGVWLENREFYYSSQAPSDLTPDETTTIEQLYILSDLVVHDPGEVYHDRITIPLWLHDWRSIGSVDQSHQDIAGSKAIVVESLDDPLYVPFGPFLGSYWTTGPVIEKVFEFQAQAPSTIELRLHFVGETPGAAPELAADIQHVAMLHDESDRAVTIEQHDTYVVIKCAVHPPTSRLVVRRLDKGITLLDAIEWSSTRDVGDAVFDSTP